MKLELPKKLQQQQMEDDDYGRITDIEGLIRSYKDDILYLLSMTIVGKFFQMFIFGFRIMAGDVESLARFWTNCIVLIFSILIFIYVEFGVDR